MLNIGMPLLALCMAAAGAVPATAQDITPVHPNTRDAVDRPPVTLMTVPQSDIVAEEPDSSAYRFPHPIVIAHRGASGSRPEHTVAAYELAIDRGADYIEPDLVAAKDLVLVARHETELSGTTDVANRDAFADRRRSKTVDGRLVSGWFAEDFMLAELRTLRAKERVPHIRPQNARYDGLYQIPTFDEIVALVRAKEAETGRRIGLYPELKTPTSLLENDGIDTVDLLVAALRKHDLDDADDPVFVQAFEVEPLRRLDALVDVPLVQLINQEGGPYDRADLTWAAMLSPAGMADIRMYADGIGPWMGHVLNADGSATSLVADAHNELLLVHPWTWRTENAFLPSSLHNGSDPQVAGQAAKLLHWLYEAGVDGVFADHPGQARAIRSVARIPANTDQE